MIKYTIIWFAWVRINYLREVLKLFLGNRAFVLFIIPLLIGFYFTLNYFSHYYYIQDSTINVGLWGEALVLYPALSSVFAALLICFNSFGINLIFNTNEFMERNSYMPSLLYVVLMSFYHSFYTLDGLLLAHTCIILMLFQFFKLRQNEDSRRYVFNGAFFSGLAATFHPPMVVWVPFVLIMIWNIKPFILRETVLALIGFMIPLVYAEVFIWVFGHRIDLKILEQTSNYYKKQTDFLITSALFTLLFLLSLVSIRARVQKSSIRLKKLIGILAWLVFVSVVIGVADFVYFSQIERFSFLMIPLSFFLTFSFTNKTFAKTAAVFFYITLVYSFVNFFL